MRPVGPLVVVSPVLAIGYRWTYDTGYAFLYKGKTLVGCWYKQVWYAWDGAKYTKANPPWKHKKGPIEISGKVIRISELWTGNGDGGIVVSVNGKEKAVSIIGSPSSTDDVPTDVELKTVKYLSELVGKKVVVKGIERDKYFIALLVKED